MSESTPPSGQYSPASDLLCNSKCDWKPGFGSRGSASPAEKRGKRQLRARRSCLPVLTDYLLWACRFEPKRSICEKPTLPWEGGDLVVKTNHLLPSLPTDCLLFFFQFIFDCSGSSLLRWGCSLVTGHRFPLWWLLLLLSTQGHARVSVAGAPGLMAQ